MIKTHKLLPFLPEAATVEMTHVLNINVGILGHVDSGKTSLGVCYWYFN
jgi:hypothetical protein